MHGINQAIRDVVGKAKASLASDTSPKISTRGGNRLMTDRTRKRAGAKEGANPEKAMKDYMGKRGIPVKDARDFK